MIGLPAEAEAAEVRGGPQTDPRQCKPPVKKETLRDLTTPQKLQAEPKAELRYPADKPKKDRPNKPEKKAAISKPEPSAKTAAAERRIRAGPKSAGGGGGSGLTIGAGGPGYGEGGGGIGSRADRPVEFPLHLLSRRPSEIESRPTGSRRSSIPG